MVDSMRFARVIFLFLNQVLRTLRRGSSSLSMANPTSGGVTASTEMLAAKRHARVLAPVIVGKMIIANQQMAYAA